MMNDPDVPKMFARDQWLIGEFDGIQVKKGQAKIFEGVMEKDMKMESADQLSDAVVSAQDAGEKWARQAESSVPKVMPQRKDVEVYGPCERGSPNRCTPRG